MKTTSTMKGGAAWLPALLLLAAAACGSEPAKQADGSGAAGLAAKGGETQAPGNSGEAAQPAPEAAPVEAATVRAVAAAVAPGPARRCGWLHNPTPGNWWLDDRDGQWVLGSQGREPAEGMHDMPDMSALDWEKTNGHYGYGCACLTITADPKTGDVTRVAEAEPKPLAQCRADKALPRP
jgi:hypothetical protein